MIASYEPDVSGKSRAFLSNGVTSASENKGVIDWFPCPKFDSASIFSAVLDDRKGGYFSVRPEIDYVLKSSYAEPGLAVNNLFKTGDGTLKVTDFLPLGIPGIVRLYKSDIPFIVEIKPVFQYGMVNAGIEEVSSGIVFRHPSLREGFEVNIKGNYKMIDEGVFRVEKGQGYIFTLFSRDLRYGLFSSHGFVYSDPYEAFQVYRQYWETQLKMAKKVKKYSKMYRRSLEVAIGLFYESSGAIIAAPTTSFPEQIGGKRNWDYRYVWVRDAAYAAEALSSVGLLFKARRALNFLTSLIEPSSKSFDHPFYSIDGSSPPPEEVLFWLKGYGGSKPVRVGNDAYLQMQSDIEGAYMSAVYNFVQNGGEKEYVKWNWWAIDAIANWVIRSWPSKSISLWEERAEPQHYVHSKVMNWVALDRAAKLARYIGMTKDSKLWASTSQQIKEDIMKNGFSEKLNSFTKMYGSEAVDSSLLTLPLYGFIDAKDEKFEGTLRLIEKDLVVESGLALRYNSDFIGRVEHPFTLLSTWLARVYIRRGELSEARTVIRKLISCSNDFMLLGEHIDQQTKQQRGNFPQLFPHAGLLEAITEINAAKRR